MVWRNWKSFLEKGQRSRRLPHRYHSVPMSLLSAFGDTAQVPAQCSFIFVFILEPHVQWSEKQNLSERYSYVH